MTAVLSVLAAALVFAAAAGACGAVMSWLMTRPEDQ